MVIAFPQWRSPIEIPYIYSIWRNCVCQRCEGAVIPRTVVDIENRVLAFLLSQCQIDRYIVEISGTISLYVFNYGMH